MCIAVIWALITFASTVTTYDYGDSTSCGTAEVPAGEKGLMDAFCNPELTHPSKLNQLRHCVCDDGYVRNAWGHCITYKECDMCNSLPNHDFHNCESACPLTCGEPVPTRCTLQCVSRCACAPGYVRASHQEDTCVPVSQCSPICPVNSTFELCVHGCTPQCRQKAPAADCIPSCHRGECVCKAGYAMDIINSAHIQLFKASLDSSQMCANAFGFFSLDKGLLVSTAASVLSFTILLVQTGQEFKTG
ncbi:uncharacterized protein [Dermacentor andersoni]|uniref:uncharacterized protein isoform X3 n=1 Tax=Dermacentor andersoni TaxID=34620 RepID=UPI002416843E|nr:zonadhesin-like isoform X3 [Dermacentor andersoni]